MIFLFSIEFGFAYAEEFTVIIPPNVSDPRNLFHFVPSNLKILVLDTVSWQNTDSVIHTVTSGNFREGADGIFNSGPLEPGDSFSYQFLWKDSGILTYFCTIHPWVNGIVTVSDPEGVHVERITESGSIEAARKNVVQGDEISNLALEFVKYKDIINSHSQAARHYDNAAIEYSLLGDNQNAAKYYQESGLQYYYAALQMENAAHIQESIKHHYLAGVQYHNAALQFNELGDYNNYGKHLGESLKHKRMAKYGSDYVMPPYQQIRWLTDPSEVKCNEDLELISRSSDGKPVCITPESILKLVQRGWATR